MFINSVQDIDQHILSYLSVKELCNACEVNKKWKKEASSDQLWGQFFSNIKLKGEMSFKQHFDNKGLTSVNSLIKRIEAFLEKIPSNGNGELHCYFPKITKCYIAVKIRRDKHFINTTYPVNKELYWFIQPTAFSSPVKDMITFTKNSSCIVHTRLPVNLDFKNFVNEVIRIATSSLTKPPRKTYFLNADEFTLGEF